MICPFCGSQIERKSWPEQVLKIGAFHEEKQIEKGRTYLHQGQKRGWGLRDSANSFQIPYSRMRQIMILYKEMQKNPEIEKIETMDSAIKFLERQRS